MLLDRSPGLVLYDQENLAASDDGQLISLRNVLPALKRSMWLIVLSVAVAAVLGIAYIATTRPGYVATTQVVIQAGKQQLVFESPGLLDLTVDTAQVESQIQILKSERIANAVIDALDLTRDPEFQPPEPTSDFMRKRIALAHFAANLGVNRVGESYVIELSFRSVDPEKAARIVNATAEYYIRDQMEAQADVARRSSKWMQERIAELGVQLNAAAAAVQKFKLENGLADDNSAGNQAVLANKLTELEARAQAYRKLYEGFLQKLTENEQAESYPLPNARVIAAATRPLGPSYPKAKLVMLFAMLSGLIVGGAVSFARSMFDHSLRSAKAVRQALGLPCLGSLPRFERELGNGAAEGGVKAIDEPFAPFTVALRNVKISIDIGFRDLPHRRIGVLSLLPGEGKTTLATSLAALFTMSGSKTLLIDGDFRGSSASRALAPAAQVGLVEALNRHDKEAICLDHKTNTYVLPLVNGSAVPNSSDVLGSVAMRSLLERLHEGFDTIFVDLPSLSLVPDARAIGPLLDSCIIVAEWGRTQIDALKDAVEMLEMSRVPLLGVVINKVDEGIPPLFGITMADLRDADWRGYGERLFAAAEALPRALAPMLTIFGRHPAVRRGRARPPRS